MIWALSSMGSFFNSAWEYYKKLFSPCLRVSGSPGWCAAVLQDLPGNPLGSSHTRRSLRATKEPREAESGGQKRAQNAHGRAEMAPEGPRRPRNGREMVRRAAKWSGNDREMAEKAKKWSGNGKGISK